MSSAEAVAAVASSEPAVSPAGSSAGDGPTQKVLRSLMLSSPEIRSRCPVFKSNAEVDAEVKQSQLHQELPSAAADSTSTSTSVPASDSSTPLHSSSASDRFLSRFSASPVVVPLDSGFDSLSYLRGREVFGSPFSPWNDCYVRSLSHCFNLVHHAGCVNTVRWNSGGDRLVSGSDDQLLVIWAPFSEKKKIDSWFVGHSNNIFHALFQPSNESVVLSCALDGQVKVSDFENRSCRSFTCHEASVHKIGLVCDDWNALLSCSDDGTVRFLDLRERHKCRSHCKNVLVSCQEIREQKSADPGQHQGQGNSFRFVKNHLVQLHSLSMHPYRGERFVVGGRDTFVREYDRRKLSVGDGNTPNVPLALYRPQLPPGYQHSIHCGVTSTVYSHDGDFLAASYSAKAVFLFDSSHSKLDAEITDDSVVFAQRMQMEQTVEEKKENLQEKVKEMEKEKEEESVTGKGKIASKRIRESGSDEYQEKEKKAKRDAKDDGTGERNEAAQTADSKKSASSGASQDSDKLVFSIQAKREHRAYSGHLSKRTVKECNFLGDRSQYVCSGSDNGCVYIWSRQTGKLLNRFHADEDVVNVVQSHPRHNYVAVSGIEDTVKIFAPADAPSLRPAAAAEDTTPEPAVCALTEEQAEEEEKSGYRSAIADDIGFQNFLDTYLAQAEQKAATATSSDDSADDLGDQDDEDDNDDEVRRRRPQLLNLFRMLPADMFRMMFGVSRGHHAADDEEDGGGEESDEEDEEEEEAAQEGTQQDSGAAESKTSAEIDGIDSKVASESEEKVTAPHAESSASHSRRGPGSARAIRRFLTALMESGLEVRVQHVDEDDQAEEMNDQDQNEDDEDREENTEQADEMEESAPTAEHSSSSSSSSTASSSTASSSSSGAPSSSSLH